MEKPQPPSSEILGLFTTITESPSPYHASHRFTQRFLKNGATELHSDAVWKKDFALAKKKSSDKKLFAHCQNGTFFGFSIDESVWTSIPDFIEKGKFNIWISHTDSPCLKIKNNGEISQDNLRILPTETYGGVIDQSWLNRDLSVAGRITTLEQTTKKSSTHKTNLADYRLIDLKRPFAIIPALAPHLKDPNSKSTLNRETHLRALSATTKDAKGLEKVVAQSIGVKQKEILGYDLFLYPTEKPSVIGEDHSLVASRSLDNLAMCHAGIEGILKATSKKGDPVINIVALFNHEEIGSLSEEGAASQILNIVLSRIINALCSDQADTPPNMEIFWRIFSRSFAISADMAHPSYFNYSEKNAETHPVELNKGIVIKRKSGLNYATQSYSEASVKALLLAHEIDWQMGIGRSDIRGGLTLGPLVASRLGIPVADIGNGLLSMHSTREIGGVEDHKMACRLATAFFS